MDPSFCTNFKIYARALLTAASRFSAGTASPARSIAIMHSAVMAGSSQNEPSLFCFFNRNPTPRETDMIPSRTNVSGTVCRIRSCAWREEKSSIAATNKNEKNPVFIAGPFCIFLYGENITSPQQKIKCRSMIFLTLSKKTRRIFLWTILKENAHSGS